MIIKPNLDGIKVAEHAKLEGINQWRIKWQIEDFRLQGPVMFVCVYSSKSVDYTIIKLICCVTSEIITLVPTALVYYFARSHSYSFDNRTVANYFDLLIC